MCSQFNDTIYLFLFFSYQDIKFNTKLKINTNQSINK